MAKKDEKHQETCVKLLQECYVWRGHLTAATEMKIEDFVENPELLEALLCARAKVTSAMETAQDSVEEWLEGRIVKSSLEEITRLTDELISETRKSVVELLVKTTAEVEPLAKGGPDHASWKHDLGDDTSMSELIAAAKMISKGARSESFGHSLQVSEAGPLIGSVSCHTERTLLRRKKVAIHHQGLINPPLSAYGEVLELELSAFGECNSKGRSDLAFQGNIIKERRYCWQLVMRDIQQANMAEFEGG